MRRLEEVDLQQQGATDGGAGHRPGSGADGRWLQGAFARCGAAVVALVFGEGSWALEIRI
jgi:hypothetical protein